MRLSKRYAKAWSNKLSKVKVPRRWRKASASTGAPSIVGLLIITMVAKRSVGARLGFSRIILLPPGLLDQNRDRHAKAGHVVQDVAADLRLDPLIG